MVRRRRREREEEQREASGRSPNVVTELLNADAIEPDTKLNLNLDAFTQEERVAVEHALQEDSSIGQAEWTGLAARKAIRWHKDGQEYSASKLVVKILEDCGFERKSAPGPRYWRLENGPTLAEFAGTLTQNQYEKTSQENTT